MKAAFIVFVTVANTAAFGQVARSAGEVDRLRAINKTTAPGTSRAGSNTASGAQKNTTPPANSTSQNRHRAVNSRGENTASPFAGGIHAAGNASKPFDIPAAGNNNRLNRRGNNTISSTVPGGNDTTFNINTIAQSGVTTTSGAIDRSGQAQFGQTNWGRSRSTVGESQWTVPPPITASFNKELPAQNSATWSRNNVDTTLYSAGYKLGAHWVTTNYNRAGQRLDTRTEYPLIQPPRAVTVFMAKQPPGFDIESIYKVQVRGKPDAYEIRTKSGKTIYLNTEGMRINY